MREKGAWFKAAKFGLFIHWGPWAKAGWEASWPLVGGVATLPLSQDIPAEEYHRNAESWTPDASAPERWVAAAANAGMKYAVLTTRHHDGYAMWPSQYGGHGVGIFAPGVDIVQAFVEACRRHGLKVGLYYSLPDWHHPSYPAFTDKDRPYVFGGYPAAKPAEWSDYQDYLRGQLTELLTNYGKIDLIWFDGSWERSAQEWDADGLEALIRRHQPEIIINDRLPGHGDYATAEQFIPAEPPGGIWETCITMNMSWGYNPRDTDFKSSAELVHTLCEVVGRGGNLLLNIGPDGAGNIPLQQAERLAAVGAFVNANGEAIFDSEPGLLPWQFYGPSAKRDANVYCCLLMQPVAPVSVRGVPVKHLKRVSELSSGTTLSFKTRIPVLDELTNVDGPGEVLIDLPASLRQPIATVLKLEFEAPL